MRAPLENHHGIKKHYLDPRGSGKKALDTLARIEVTLLIYAFLIALTIFAAYWAFALFFFYLFNTLNLNLNTKALRTLPLRLPLKAGNVIDYNTSKVANRFKFEKATGNVFIGNHLFNKKELWEPSALMLTHFLIIGSTGAGKTQTLISLNAASSLLLGGACTYLDAKAFIDVSFYFENLARIFGREDSIRYMSFRTGNKSVQQGHWRKLSNTVGIFAGGSADVCIQVLEGMMPEAGQNQVFKDKAISIIKGFMPCAEELRDQKVINLTPYMISQLMTIPKLIQMAWPEYYDKKISYIDNYSGEEVIIPNVISERKSRALQSVLEKLGVKVDEKSLKDPSKQPAEVGKQFSFADGYIVKPLVDFGSTYGHIFECELGEIDTRDIMINNHILLNYIPATETSKDSRKTQGRIGLSLIRLAISSGMGDKSEGEIDDIFLNLPIDKIYISTITIDEYAEAAVEGFAVTSTQARGFGISMIFSNQDIPGMLNSSPEETKQIFGNTRIKYLMSLEDPNETFEWFAKLAGDITVLVTSNYSKELDMAYRDSLQAQVEKMSRIDFLDVKMQESSEAHIFEGDKLIRAKTFYHGLDGFPVSDVQFSRQLEVKAPTIEQAAQLKAKYMAKRVVNNMIERLEFPDSRASNLKVEVSKNDWIEKLLASPLDTSDGGFAETQEQQELAVEGVEINTAKPKIAASLNPGKIVQQKKNNWVYGFKTSPNLKNEDALSKSLSEVAIAAGVEPNAAKIMAADQAKTVSDSLKYTSVPISADKQDIDDMWDALKALD